MDNGASLINLDPDSDIIYYPNFLETVEADFYFDYLRENIPWQQDSITLFQRTRAN